MRKKTPKQQRKPANAALTKTGKKGKVELTEQDLGKVSAGATNQWKWKDK